MWNLVHTSKGKGTPKKYWELWKKIKGHITSLNIKSDNYDEKYMKIKFNSDNDLLWRKHYNCITW